VALVGASLPLVAPPARAAGECEGMRSFTGMIQKFKKGKKGRFVVDNRMGDKVKFVKPDSPRIVDQRDAPKPKQKWADLRNGDYVMVCWKFTDNPRKAYTVVVKPPPDEKGEDL